MSVAPADVSEESVSDLVPESERTTTDSSRRDRNTKYYFDDPMAIFLVGNQLFKVHRHFLVKESDVFKWMFLCPAGSNDPDGFRPESAIPLPGVTASEFESLLDYFYDEKFQRYEATMQEWIDLLSISTRFDFERVRQRAISAIDHCRWPQRSWPQTTTIDPVDQILLAEKHNIPHWFRIAYESLCARGHPLEEWEAEKIGYRRTVLLARTREAIRNPHHQPPAVVLPPPPSPALSAAPSFDPMDSAPGSPNGFHHSRARVSAIVSEVFFPPPIAPQTTG